MDVERYLELGKKSLAAGQLSEALSHYHMAVGEFFSDEMNGFKMFILRAKLFL